jgi:hypothetical protein
MLGLAFRRLGLPEDAERMAKRAESRAVEDIVQASFLMQLQASRGGDVSDAVRFALGARQGKGWRTTMEGAHAVLGLSAVLARAAGDYATPGRVTVQVNGAAVRDLELPAKVDPMFDGRVAVPEPEAGWGDKVVVRFTFSGQGVAFYTAALEGVVGGEDPAPVSRGMSIARRYYEMREGAWRLVDGSVAAGRPVLVRLTIESPAPREYVMVTDPRPDGFEPLEVVFRGGKALRRAVESLTDEVDCSEGWGARLDEFRRAVRGDASRESRWAIALLDEIFEKRRFRAKPVVAEDALPVPASPSWVEHRDDRSLFFLGQLPAGVTELCYVARAEHAGRMHVLPASATPMYAPEVFAQGREARLDATDARLVAPARPGRVAAPPPGTEDLREIVRTLRDVDADRVIELVQSGCRVGALLAMLVTDPRGWLSVDAATAAAGPDLGERIAAARRDIAARRALARELAGKSKDWRAAVEGAMADDGLARRVFAGAGASDTDEALLWIQEDRAYRLELLTGLLEMKGSARVEDVTLRSVTLGQILGAMGAKAPSGERLVAWKLSQKVRCEAPLLEFVDDLKRDLGLEVKVMTPPPSDAKVVSDGGTVGGALDDTLKPWKLYWRVKGATVVIGTLEEVTRG